MLSEEEYKLFTTHPTGKIPKNAFCKTCCRFNLRHSTVEAVIPNEKGEILMMKRASNPQVGWWGLIGGYVDWNETLDEAIKREVKEETGLDATTVTFLKHFDSIDRDLDGRQNIGHCFVVQATGTLQRQIEEVSELRWFPLEALPEHIAFDHREMIEVYKKSIGL